MASASKQAAAELDLPDGGHGDLDAFIGYNLKRAYVVVNADFRKALGEGGFGPRVFSALSLIIRFPNVTQSELARKLGIERSGLVAIIDELENRGLVKRQAVPGDRRVQALVATAAGAAAYDNAHQTVCAHEAALLSGFTAREIATLTGLLQRIRDIGD